MKKAAKDPYSVLGVSSDASDEDIRAAYRARARIVHPDRFDRERQPKDWERANEMLAELNEAYSILIDRRNRPEYGQQRTKARPTPPPPEPPPRRPFLFEAGELTPGYARYVDLPEHVQARLRNRQDGSDPEQFQVKLASIAWNYIFMAILLYWFLYLYSAADGAKWEKSTILWYLALTLVVGLLIGCNILALARWTNSTLRPYFYVTPIYFIKTEYDIVSFRLIWALKDIAVTHNYRNGLYQNSDVVLKFDGQDESLRLSPKERVEGMLNCLKTYDSRLRSAFNSGNYEYFRKHDDFAGVSRSRIPANVILPVRVHVGIYALSVALCGAGLFSAVRVNDRISETRSVRHPPPGKSAGTAPAGPLTWEDILTPIPEEPVPTNGFVRTFTLAERVAPFEIKAGYGSHYLLKMVDAYTKKPVLTVFVRSGMTAHIDVPLGTYEVRYAAGDIWYGEQYRFGPETAYSKADTTFSFQVIGSQVRGFTITLYRVPSGNLHTSRIRPEEF